MKIYRLAQTQLDFFQENPFNNKQDVQKPVEPVQEEQIEPKSSESPDIAYVGVFDKYYIQFRIGSQYWVYRLSFAGWVDQARNMAIKYSPAKARNFAASKASAEYEVTKDFPSPGSIIRNKELR